MTSNPLTRLPASIIMKAFIAIKNSPNVNIVTGSVNKINNGRKNRFIIDKTIATTIAVKNVSTLIPGIKYAEINIATDDKITLINQFIVYIILN